MSDDVTTKILIEIRDEIRTTNQRLDQTKTELKEEISLVRTELALVRTELREEIGQVRGEAVERELRLATQIVEQTAATRDLYTMLTGQLDLRDRVERCERDIGDLKKRVG